MNPSPDKPMSRTLPWFRSVTATRETAQNPTGEENEIHFDDEHDEGWPRRAQLAQERPAGAHRLYDGSQQRVARMWRAGVGGRAVVSRPSETGASRQGWPARHRRRFSGIQGVSGRV